MKSECEKLDLLNKFKESLSEELLTKSQKNILEKISDSRRVMNVYGDNKSGKTVLAWHLSNNLNWSYYSRIPREIDSKNLIIDNQKEDRDAERKCIAISQYPSVNKVIYISVDESDEVRPSFQLRRTEEDLDKMRKNLISISNKRFDNYNDLINVIYTEWS